MRRKGKEPGYMKRYYLQNRDKLIARSKKWAKENKEYNSDYHKLYYLNHRELTSKVN